MPCDAIHFHATPVLAIFERSQWWRKETYLSPALKRFISLDLLTVSNMVVKTNLLI